MNHEPRVSHERLSAILGYDQSARLRVLIERNEAEFCRYGEVSRTVRETSAKGGRPGTTLWLNEGHCCLATALSDAPNAAEGRFQIISVFMAYRRGSFVPAAISPAGRKLWVANIGGKEVLIDTAVYDVAENQEAVVLRRDGSIVLGHVSTRDGQDWPSASNRNAMTGWRKPSRSERKAGIGKSRETVTVLGLVVTPERALTAH